MAVTRGPVPKRSDQRRRANKPEVEVAKGQSAPPESITAPDPDPAWHPSALRWYVSLGKSGQRAWYQPSDWAEAHVWTGLLSQQLESSRPSAMLLAAWSAASARLLTTEGDRRRVRIELERAQARDPDKEAGVASMKAWRDKLAGGA